MAILVTGGAGYIGSVTVERLHARGRAVVVVDDLVRGHREALPDAVPLVVGDLREPDLLASVFSRHEIDAVLHFAAWSQVGESMTDPALYFRNNVSGVLHLLESMTAAGIERFILSSTAATYGDPGLDVIRETVPSDPTNPYGESKRMAERLLHWFGRVHGLRWTALRYFNAAGASERCGEDHEPETHLIPLALRAAAGLGDPLRVFGLDYPTPDGSCIRDYIHVIDLAEAHILALDRLERETTGIFNLGNGAGFSVLEVIAAVERVTGRAVPWAAAPRRAGDPPRLVASSELARSALGWSPQHSEIDAIVASAWRWMEAHPTGYAG